MSPEVFIATQQDGSQIMVTLWPRQYDLGPDVGEVATRPDAHATWGIPTPLEVAP